MKTNGSTCRNVNLFILREEALLKFDESNSIKAAVEEDKEVKKTAPVTHMAYTPEIKKDKTIKPAVKKLMGSPLHKAPTVVTKKPVSTKFTIKKV